MYTDKKITTWYGKMVVNDNTFYVIHDKRITSDDAEKIYLYHSGRQKLVLFLESIAKDKFQELDDGELAQAKKECDPVWEEILLEHIKRQEKLFEAPKKKAKKDGAEEEPEEAFRDDDQDLDDDMELGFEGGLDEDDDD